MVGHDDLVEYLHGVNPKITLIQSLQLLTHYFLTDYSLRSLRLHSEPKECFAATLANLRGRDSEPKVLNLGGAGYLGLCAGSGQLMGAAAALGAEPILASDSDATARWLLEQRFKATRVRVLGAMEDTNWADLPNHLRQKVLAGAAGFPCAAFSRMGKQLGSHDRRAWLGYWAIKEILPWSPKCSLSCWNRWLKSHS